MTTIELRGGVAMPSPGIGTWRMGETPATAETEAAALARALELGFAHVDTAEMYGEGGAERLLGRVLAAVPRDAVFVTSKVYPWNAGAAEMERACERSLARLGLDHLDLYLLHWPGSVPIGSTLEGAERLRAAGKIRAFGVSNADPSALAAMRTADAGDLIAVNQVLYNPARRGIEFDLLPMMQADGVACVAYTPIEPGRVGANAGFRRIAAEAGLGPAELALAWHMTRGVACPIPKAATAAHVDALARASAIRLGPDVMAAVDAVFPPPDRAVPLDIL